MYLSDIILDIINPRLIDICKNKEITVNDYDTGEEITFICKHASLSIDDGNCLLYFIDKDGNGYYAEGQGTDIWFDVNPL